MQTKSIMPIKFTGQVKMNAELKQLLRQFPEKAAASLFKRANVIMTVSKRDFVPVKWGILRGTGIVFPAEFRRGFLSVELAYGGPAAPYAVTQHEVKMAHKVGEWKYLQTPMNKAVPNLARDIASDIRL